MSRIPSELFQWIETHRPSRIAVLTGAGVSAESGIPTFRDAGGLWENFRAEELATPQAFARDPKTVWRWYEYRRKVIRDAQPNAAHVALARLESSLRGRGSLTLITQNVDGLHRRAGSQSVIELHGNIFRVRCTREQTRSDRPEPFAELPAVCQCGALLRPDVVWFGEMLNHSDLERASEAVIQSELLLVIGTSAVVHPAAGLVSLQRDGASVEINPQQTPVSGLADFAVRDSAASATPLLVEAIERALR